MRRGVESTKHWTKTNLLVKDNGLISKGDDGTDNYVEEKHITVIRKAPFSAPKILLSDTERISEGSDEATVHVPTNTTHIATPVDGGTSNTGGNSGAAHDNIYSSSRGVQMVFNNSIQVTTNSATNASGDAFTNDIFIDPNQTDLNWKTGIGIGCKRDTVD